MYTYFDALESLVGTPIYAEEHTVLFVFACCMAFLTLVLTIKLFFVMSSLIPRGKA